ncbi:GNAT family N-acetyltransferase [Subtercola endophyticus]|uniref:GNAT family N-acetyltransferase n=1 Tax=Subtercola endophyticus TaxID=2895559 RepID=UPI001E46FFBD|nr:GNAT family N-acetyltransferase [Subtercola endophyticus]UFS60140.1 GNAT family N-acetyltransferase [Subtercola endophyticus]
MRLRETAVTSPDAVRLLTEYFESRELGFPTNQGAYKVTFPPPEHFVPPAGVFVVIDSDEGVPVGCGGIRRIAASELGLVRYEVKHVWVEPEYRGHGWAAALMADLEARASAFGADEVVLDTNASLEAAARLYARSGYRPIEPYNDNPNATNWYAKTL